jgi:hypothetical protein
MTTASTETHPENNQEESHSDFHGAAIIDNQGHEVPITDEMVKNACEDLERQRVKS